MAAATRTPALFLCHGGGPMPLLGHQPELVKQMKKYREDLFPKGTPLPQAILIVTAHYETSISKVGGAAQPKMMYDYGGFPPETYKYQYPAPGMPELAAKAVSLLKGKGLEAAVDPNRPFDHGVFVPLMIMFPEATIPVVPVSVLRSQDPREHIAVGQALSPLRDEGVFILGSGSSSHNQQSLHGKPGSLGVKFNKRLAQVITDTRLTMEQQKSDLSDCLRWEGAEEAHPKDGADHLMPLFTVLGSSHFFQDASSASVDSCHDGEESGSQQKRLTVTPPSVHFFDMGAWAITEYTFKN